MVYLVCGFEVFLHVLNFVVIGQYTVDLSESNKTVRGNDSHSKNVTTGVLFDTLCSWGYRKIDDNDFPHCTKI